MADMSSRRSISIEERRAAFQPTFSNEYAKSLLQAGVLREYDQRGNHLYDFREASGVTSSVK